MQTKQLNDNILLIDLISMISHRRVRLTRTVADLRLCALSVIHNVENS